MVLSCPGAVLPSRGPYNVEVFLDSSLWQLLSRMTHSRPGIPAASCGAGERPWHSAANGLGMDQLPGKEVGARGVSLALPSQLQEVSASGASPHSSPSTVLQIIGLIYHAILAL